MRQKIKMLLLFIQENKLVRTCIQPLAPYYTGNLQLKTMRYI